MARQRVLVTAMVVVAIAPWIVAVGQTAPSPPEEDAATGEAAQAPVAKRQQKPADDNDGRCDVCGSCECVRKVCVPKPKEREVKKVCWSYKCEEFCIPGPSEACGSRCRKDTCGWWWYDIWRPTWATMHTKKVPVKTEVTRTVPGFEWKPEERCAHCRGRGAHATCAADAAP